MLVARRPIFVYIDLSLRFAAITVPFGTGPILKNWSEAATLEGWNLSRLPLPKVPRPPISDLSRMSWT